MSFSGSMVELIGDGVAFVTVALRK